MYPESSTLIQPESLQVKRKWNDSNASLSVPDEILSPDTSTIYRRKHLRVEIPSSISSTNRSTFNGSPDTSISEISEPDSLFDDPLSLPYSTPTTISHTHLPPPALRSAPPIQGLFFSPTLQLPEEVADDVTSYCLKTYFQARNVNQVMLFGRSSKGTHDSSLDAPQTQSSPAGLPPILLSLLSTLDTLLLSLLPPNVHALLFPRVPVQARQAIVNLYKPGEGISPHVDLLGRFGDGIVGVSLGSGCTMQFQKAKPKLHRQTRTKDTIEQQESWDVYLPERSVIVLSGDARYGWTHGIRKHKKDYVSLPDQKSPGRWIERGLRLSITFRWLLPGADIVGDDHIAISDAARNTTNP